MVPAAGFGDSNGGGMGLLLADSVFDWLPRPGALFNPVVSPPETAEPLGLLISAFAGPMGLVAFLPLIPVVLLAARWKPRAALAGAALVWLVATLQVRATLVLLAGVGVGAAYVQLLAALRRREVLSRRGMVALVWVGLHGLIFPLWWWPQQAWYRPLSPMAALHTMGFAYFLLRFIAWGVALAEDPRQPRRLGDTLCWVLYPPCMRLGPVLLREQFLERLAAWQGRVHGCAGSEGAAERPVGGPDLRGGAKRFAMCALGAAGLLVMARNTPHVAPGAPSFFAAPEAYATSELLRVFYLVPIEVYLLLWTYNQLALAASLWLGIRVDDNFDHVPLSTSVRDFWRRWHITVGDWLRKYVYIPLGGNRRHVGLNYVLVFGYCGLWHGPSWSFVAWGLSQGVALVVQRGWDRLRRREARTGGREGGERGARAAIWTGICWIVTMHYQLVTIVMFCDFDHLGLRLFGELVRRCV